MVRMVMKMAVMVRRREEEEKEGRSHARGRNEQDPTSALPSQFAFWQSRQLG